MNFRWLGTCSSCSLVLLVLSTHPYATDWAVGQGHSHWVEQIRTAAHKPEQMTAAAVGTTSPDMLASEVVVVVALAVAVATQSIQPRNTHVLVTTCLSCSALLTLFHRSAGSCLCLLCHCPCWQISFLWGHTCLRLGSGTSLLYGLPPHSWCMRDPLSLLRPPGSDRA